MSEIVSLDDVNLGEKFKSLTVLKVVDPVGRVSDFVEENPGWILVQNVEDDSVFLMKKDTQVEIVE